VVLGGHFVTNALSGILKLFMSLITFIALLYSHDYLRERQGLRGEYFVLSLFAVLGMMVMVSAHSFLTLYLGLELLSLDSLVAYLRVVKLIYSALM
jgi:NADH-quinone oxidoreductase subunit N